MTPAGRPPPLPVKRPAASRTCLGLDICACCFGPSRSVLRSSWHAQNLAVKRPSHRRFPRKSTHFTVTNSRFSRIITFGIMSMLTQVLSNTSDGPRSDWIYVPYDQLYDCIGPQSRFSPEQCGIVLMKPRAKADRPRYRRLKLALVLSNMRHIASEQARRGTASRYCLTERSYATTLAARVAKSGPLYIVEAAEHELRVELALLAGDGLVEPCNGWLSSNTNVLPSP